MADTNPEGAIERAQSLLDGASSMTDSERKRVGIQVVRDLDADGSEEAMSIKTLVGRRVYGIGGPSDSHERWTS